MLQNFSSMSQAIKREADSTSVKDGGIVDFDQIQMDRFSISIKKAEGDVNTGDKG